MAWSYRYRADDQLYADDEHGPTVFDPGAPISAGSGNVVAVGIPILGQLATWTDATHIAGSTILPNGAHPAHTGDVTSPSGSVVLTYANPIPASKGGLPTGGAGGQVLVKNTGANYDTGWATGGGNVSNVATPTAGQLALWTDATHVQGVTLLPAVNHPALTGDVVVASGTLVTSYNNAVPTAKAGLPAGGSTGQVLSKIDGTNYNTTWINPPSSGGNVANTGSPQAGQLALWTDVTHIQGVAVLPAINSPILTGDITSPSGTAVTTYNNPVPAAKAGVPVGGTTDQVLKKNSATNYDTSWVTPAAGGAGTPGGTSGQPQYNLAGAFAGVQKVVMVAPGTGTLGTAAAAASAGTLLQLMPGDYTENTSPLIELPNDVHLKGAGMYVSRVLSNRPATLAPFHGIIAPGNNSVISDLSVVPVTSPIGNEHINSFSNRAGSTRSWTNVLVQNCWVGGGADCIINGGGMSLGDMTFVNCVFESQNDCVMWQSPTTGIFVDCVFRHRTKIGNEGLSAVGLYAGAGFVKAYHCRYEYVGANDAFGEYIPVMSDAPFEVYDFVIDLRLATAPLPPGADISVGTAGTMFISNVRRWDGAALKYYNVNPPVVIDERISSVVARLPASPVVGQTATVTDGAASLAYSATVTGGGSAKYLVMWNGSNWIVVGGGTSVGGDLTYVHNQVSPSASWSVVHNLGKFPSVSVVDSGLTLIIPDVLYINTNQLTVSFGSATSGKAYLN